MNNQNVRHLTEEIDQQLRKLPEHNLQAPAFGAPRRQAMESLVDDLCDDICKEIKALHETLDTIQQQILESAAGAKAALQEHVSLGASLKDEISHARKVVEDMKARVPHIP